MPSEADERWFALSEGFPIGPKRHGGLLRATESSDTVTPGQVRQAYWRDVRVVVIIDSIDDATAEAQVFPATLEANVEDRSSVIIDESDSPLHGPIVVWPSLPASIPLSVLGALIASIPGPLLRVVKQASIPGAVSRGLRRGYDDPPLGSGAARALDELFDAIDVLREAPRLQYTVDATPKPLNLPLPTIMAALDVPQARAMAIRLGKDQLSVEEAALLAAAAGIQTDDVLATVSPLPSDLLRELQEPRWRPAIRDRADDGDEDTARTRLGYEAYRLAARETGTGREVWRQRLETVLASEGD